MPPPSTAPLLSECSNCLLIMICLAFIAGVFMVIAAILCERVFRGSLPPERRGVPSVWRQGGTLWIEPNRDRAEPDVLLRQSDTVPLWIQRSHHWFQDILPAEPRSCDSTDDLQMETYSPTSSSPLSDHNEQTWGVQPRVTLQDLKGFFQQSTRGT